MIDIMDGTVKNFKASLSTTEYIYAEDCGIDGAELIPVDLGGRLALHSSSINELGKQLLKAAGDGNVDEIRALMNKGAPFTADWLGTSPLHLAAQNNHVEVCEILLKAGISRDARTKVDRTPLHMAAYEGHVDVVECLLRHGADHDCIDLLGMTPLHWAVQNAHENVVSLLIRYGASTIIRNKFDLTPSLIALQIKRPDIENIISAAVRDPFIATEKLCMEMNSNDNSTASVLDIKQNEEEVSNATVPIEAILLEENAANNTLQNNNSSNENIDCEPHLVNSQVNQEEDSISESLRLLQQHGITMLPTDDCSILSSVMENGHSVVLTDIGKEVLNSINTVEQVQPQKPQTVKMQTVQITPKKKKIITVTSDEFFQMTNNGMLNVNGNVLRQINSKLVTMKPTLKRIVMKKNKIIPISPSVNIAKPRIEAVDLDTILKQLADAQTTIEEYKVKLKRKELEIEKYKQQIQLLISDKI